FIQRDLDALHEVRVLLVHGQLGGVFFGFLLLGEVEGGDRLIRVIEHGPDDALPHHLGRARPWLGLGLGFRLGLDGFLLSRCLLVVVALVYLFALVVLVAGLLVGTTFLFGFFLIFVFFGFVFGLIDFVFGLATLSGFVIGAKVFAIENASCH